MEIEISVALCLGPLAGFLLLLVCFFCLRKRCFKKEEGPLPTRITIHVGRVDSDLDNVRVDRPTESATRNITNVQREVSTDYETSRRTKNVSRTASVLPGHRSLYAEQTNGLTYAEIISKVKDPKSVKGALQRDRANRYLTIVPTEISTIDGKSKSIKIVPRSRPCLPVAKALLPEVARPTNDPKITVIRKPRLNVNRGISIVPKGRIPSGNINFAPSRGNALETRDQRGDVDRTPDSAEVIVTKVPDGDGVQTYNYQKNETLDIRLIGIDAPEMKGNQPFARVAKQYLERMVLKEIVILTRYDLDQYDRVLGSLEVEGKVQNVSLEMLKAGLAEVYKGKGAEYGGRRNEFFEAERKAKSQRKGFWSLDNVVLPSEFKRKERNRNN